MSGKTLVLTLTGTDLLGSLLCSLCQRTVTFFSYAPYGANFRDSGTLVLPGFSGERRDPALSVTHLGNGYRAFSYALMRFSCPDSESPFESGGLNPYAYCASDPLNRADPSGHIFRQIIELGELIKRMKREKTALKRRGFFHGPTNSSGAALHQQFTYDGIMNSGRSATGIGAVYDLDSGGAWALTENRYSTEDLTGLKKDVHSFSEKFGKIGFESSEATFDWSGTEIDKKSRKSDVKRWDTWMKSVTEEYDSNYTEFDSLSEGERFAASDLHNRVAGMHSDLLKRELSIDLPHAFQNLKSDYSEMLSRVQKRMSNTERSGDDLLRVKSSTSKSHRVLANPKSYLNAEYQNSLREFEALSKSLFG